jgi:hypothetical protein
LTPLDVAWRGRHFTPSPKKKTPKIPKIPKPQNREQVLRDNDITKFDVISTINKDNSNSIPNQWLKKLHAELKPIKKALLGAADPALLRGGSTRNPVSSVVNKLLCIEQNKVLLAVEAASVDAQVLMFDGFMIGGTPNSEDLLATLTELSSARGVQWKVKERRASERTCSLSSSARKCLGRSTCWRRRILVRT